MNTPLAGSVWIMFVLTGMITLSLLIFLIVIFQKTRRMVTKTLPMGQALAQLGASMGCPRCDRPMQRGFTVAPRGILWRGEHEKRTGILTPLWKVLPNTTHMGFSQKENIAWRCSECNLILVDHSALIGAGK